MSSCQKEARKIAKGENPEKQVRRGTAEKGQADLRTYVLLPHLTPMEEEPQTEFSLRGPSLEGSPVTWPGTDCCLHSEWLHAAAPVTRRVCRLILSQVAFLCVNIQNEDICRYKMVVKV